MADTTSNTVHFGGTDVRGIVTRFKAALEQPRLALSVEGGGIADKQTVFNDLALIVDRRDIVALVGVLEANDLVPR